MEQLCATKFDGIEPTLIENETVEAFSYITDGGYNRMAEGGGWQANGLPALHLIKYFKNGKD